MRTVKTKTKKTAARVARKESKIKDIVFALSKTKGIFSRKKLVDLGAQSSLELLIKHFFLKKESKKGHWSFCKSKIEARGYKDLKELCSKEGFFRSDLYYLLATKNKRGKYLHKRIVSDSDKKISENLFNLTYSN